MHNQKRKFWYKGNDLLSYGLYTQSALPLSVDIKEEKVSCMSNINKNILVIIVIINYCFLVNSNETLVSKQQFVQQNKTIQFQERRKNVFREPPSEKLTTLDYYFFTYNVIDHNTLLVKFDITRTILFQSTSILYEAYLYISKLPATNYKIHIESFTGIYEKELDGTITDHFTFCLILMPKIQNNTFNRNNQTKTIFHQYLRSSYRSRQQQHFLHYCTKMGPDEDRYHHLKKQGSEGDRILLLLQIMMIGIFLLIIQIAHTNKYRKYKEAFRREVAKVRQELRTRRQSTFLPHGALDRLRFAPINDGEEAEQEKKEEEQQKQQKEEESNDEDEVFLIASHRRQPSPIRKRSRSRTHSATGDVFDDETLDPSIEHILETKPWLQIPK